MSDPKPKALIWRILQSKRTLMVSLIVFAGLVTLVVKKQGVDANTYAKHGHWEVYQIKKEMICVIVRKLNSDVNNIDGTVTILTFRNGDANFAIQSNEFPREKVQDASYEMRLDIDEYPWLGGWSGASIAGDHRLGLTLDANDFIPKLTTGRELHMKFPRKNVTVFLEGVDLAVQSLRKCNVELGLSPTGGSHS